MKTAWQSFSICAVLLLPLVVHSIALGADKASKGGYIAYIGTYTNKQSKGIYAFRFDASTGKLTPLGLAAEATSPSFLAVHPNRKFLYAAIEVNEFGGQKAGAVSAFSIDLNTSKLKFLNTVSARGTGPCHVSVDKTGKDVLVANYDGGSVAVLPVNDDGSLRDASAFVQHTGSSVNKERQEAPHAHCFFTSPDNRFALAADLGLDEVVVYRFDPARGSLTPNNPPFGKTPPGSGPRHFAFHPNGRFVYVINEIKCTLSTFSYDAAHGTLKELQTVSTLPDGYKVTGDDSTAEVRVHPSGKFVYGSNRGHDSIAVFAVDSAKGTVTPVERVSTQGKTPRGFGIDPTGGYLIAGNQDSDSLVVFRIDPKTGRLTPTGQKLEAFAPVDVEFVAVK
jgi:6-phosphogluconolactonase